MATTTNYTWSTPDDTALVKDGAAAIRTLGSSADTTVKALNPGTTAGDIDYYTTSTAKARVGIGTAGQVLQVNSGATAPEWATPAGSAPASASATVATEETTTSGTYTDLTTAGPAVTLTTGTKVLVIITADIRAMSAARNGSMSYAISGATTSAASENDCLGNARILSGAADPARMSSASRRTITAGSNTFTAKYKSADGSATITFKTRDIIVIDLGS
jgi:hypothetical protein